MRENNSQSKGWEFKASGHGHHHILYNRPQNTEYILILQKEVEIIIIIILLRLESKDLKVFL